MRRILVDAGESFCKFVQALVVAIVFIVTVMTQLELTNLFTVAQHSRHLLEHVQTPSGADYQTVDDISEIYDWIHALHSSVAELDFVTSEHFTKYSTIHGAHSVGQGGTSVQWDATSQTYVIPDCERSILCLA